jgi:hypothetical protein
LANLVIETRVFAPWFNWSMVLQARVFAALAMASVLAYNTVRMVNDSGPCEEKNSVINKMFLSWHFCSY